MVTEPNPTRVRWGVLGVAKIATVQVSTVAPHTMPDGSASMSGSLKARSHVMWLPSR